MKVKVNELILILSKILGVNDPFKKSQGTTTCVYYFQYFSSSLQMLTSETEFLK